MSSLLTRIQISDKSIVYQELKLKQYKTILKCLIGNPIDTQNLFINLNNILSTITNLSNDELLNFNILEYFLLLTEIRVTSLGSSIFAVYKQNNESINIEIPLQKTIKNLQHCINNIQSVTIKDHNINFTFCIPKIKDIFNQKDFLMIQEEVNDLPVKFLKTINVHSNLISQKIAKYYFYDAPIKKYSINFSTKANEYIQLIKILFNENLISIYDNIYYLSKICNMSAEYLENCTYGEFKIFVKKTEQTLQKKIQPTPKIEQITPEFEQIDINSLYGNDETNFNVSRSEFTP